MGLRTLLFALGMLVALPVLAGVVLLGTLWWLTPSQPVEPPLPGRLLTQTLVHEDLSRRWLAYVPAGLATAPPVLFALHGSSQTPEHYRSLSRYRFDQLAERDGFLVVYPEGFELNWNGCRLAQRTEAHDRNLDDAGFLLRVLEELASRYSIDRSRVYATGLSNGGQLAYRLASEHPDRFAAVAAVVAQVPTEANQRCAPPLGRVSVLIMNGSADPIIPFEGGEASFYGYFSAGEVRSMDESLAYWRLANGITAAGVPETLDDRDPDDGSRIERTTWRSADGVEVVGFSIRGGGHTMPGGWQYAPPFIVGTTNRDVLAPDEIWSFLSRHEREGA